MKLLMAFLLGTFILAVARADRPARPRLLPMLLVCLVVSAGFLTRRLVG